MLAEDSQQNWLLVNVECRQVLRIATVFICLAFRDSCNETFICVCKALSHKKVSRARVHFTLAALYMDRLVEEFCTGLLALCTRVLSGETQNFDSCRTEIDNAFFALLEEIER